MKARTVTIAQPTFLPWLGWFDLADQADLLILLDDVSFSRQSWQQRNRVRTRDGLAYLTVPVTTAKRFGQLIVDTGIADLGFVDKVIRTIAQNYSRAAHFDAYFDEFSATLRLGAGTRRLVELNCGLIDWLARRLGVTTPRIRSSEMAVDGKRGEHVAKLCQSVGAARYLSAAGAEEYLMTDRAAFESREIGVELHAYEHPIYRQCFRPFVPYASALDLLLNEGPAAGDMLRAGRRPTRQLRAAVS